MRRLKQVGLGTLAALVGALAATTPAHAVTHLSAVCAVTGSAMADVNWDANNGPYTFHPLAGACVGEYATTDYGPASAGPGIATIAPTSAGAFYNVACGTGTAGDPNALANAAPVLNPVFAAILNDADFGYSIVFTSGQGTLVWSQSGAVPPGTPPSPNLGGGSRATGWYPVGGGPTSISPLLPVQGGAFPGPSPGTPGTLCTNGFNVAGTLGVVIAG